MTLPKMIRVAKTVVGGFCMMMFFLLPAYGQIFEFQFGKNGGDGLSGTQAGEFNNPSGVVVDASGLIYVAEIQNLIQLGCQ